MKTIPADYNALTESDCLRLPFSDSQEAIRSAGLRARDWAWLSDGEVIVGAQLGDDQEYGLVAVPDRSTQVHLGGEEATDFQHLWLKLEPLLRNRDGSAEDEAEVFRLFTIIEQVAPPERRVQIPPGYLPFRRAGALWSMGKTGLALVEVMAALQDRPDDPDTVYFYLELLLREDRDRAAREAQSMAEQASTSAPVLAACIDIWATLADDAPDHEFRALAPRILEWADRFDAAPGREDVRTAVLASVHFNRGLVLLRMGQTEKAQESLRLAHVTYPAQPALAEAAQLDRFNDKARELACRFRSTFLPRAA